MSCVVDIVLVTFQVFEPIIENTIRLFLNIWRAQILPPYLEIPYTPLSLSLSLPDVPQLGERVILPIDGTIFVTEDGYNPHEDVATDMPAFDDTDSNNIQVFFNEYCTNTFFESAASTGFLIDIPETFFTDIGLETDIHYTDGLEHVFNGVSQYFPHNTYLDIFVGIEPEYDSEVEFRKGNV